MTKVIVEAHGYVDFFEGGDSLRNGDSPKDGVCLHMMGPFYYLGSQSISLTQYVCLSVRLSVRLSVPVSFTTLGYTLTTSTLGPFFSWLPSVYCNGSCSCCYFKRLIACFCGPLQDTRCLFLGPNTLDYCLFY